MSAVRLECRRVLAVASLLLAAAMSNASAQIVPTIPLPHQFHGEWVETRPDRPANCSNRRNGTLTITAERFGPDARPIALQRVVGDPNFIRVRFIERVNGEDRVFVLMMRVDLSKRELTLHDVERARGSAYVGC